MSPSGAKADVRRTLDSAAQIPAVILVAALENRCDDPVVPLWSLARNAIVHRAAWVYWQRSTRMILTGAR
jgi:hypothetical protein